jgi:hypothetical protein
VWWLHWLINSIADPQKGPAWFQQQLTQWLAHLPDNKRALGEDYGFLRLLTNDLEVLTQRISKQYPKFYNVVISFGQHASEDSLSRQAYLKQYAPDNLLDQIMSYWKSNLHTMVPNPESAHKSNYAPHAEWMSALRELSPQDYQTLLAHWHTKHRRRRNLWRDLRAVGLS